MKTTIENLNKVQVNERLDIIAKSESLLCNFEFIWSDMYHSLTEFNDAAPSVGEWFFAIRKMGVESGTKEHVKQRCEVLGNPHIVIKVVYDWDKETYTMIISSRG